MTPVRTPSAATLQRYGLSLLEWQGILARQNGVCAVCKNVPDSGTLHIDHEHALGWKKMPPDYRKTFVRGLLCYRCNTRFVSRGMTYEHSREVYKYLGAYQILANQRPPPPPKRRADAKCVRCLKKIGRRGKASLFDEFPKLRWVHVKCA